MDEFITIEGGCAEDAVIQLREVNNGTTKILAHYANETALRRHDPQEQDYTFRKAQERGNNGVAALQERL
jgi:hypothetical protein